MTTVSVIIPAFNADKYLAESVRSVIAQSFSDWELVIVDDGSSDSTAQIARAYTTSKSNIKLVQQENRGLSAARNSGYEHSSQVSKFFLFLDSDDVLEPYALERLIAGYDEDPTAKIVFGSAHYIDAAGSFIGENTVRYPLKKRYAFRHNGLVDVPWDEPTSFDVLVVQNCIRTPGVVLVPRTSIEQTGLFSTRLRCLEDWDLWLRMSVRGKLTQIRDVVLRYRVHGENMSGRRANMLRGEFIMKSDWFSSPDLMPDQRSLAIAASKYLYRCDPGYVVRLNDVRRMIVSRLKSERKQEGVAVAQEDDTTIPLRDLVLLVTLNGDRDLADAVRSWDETPDKCSGLSADERMKLTNALSRMDWEELKLRCHFIRTLTAEGQFGAAARNLYRSMLCLGRRCGAGYAY